MGRLKRRFLLPAVALLVLATTGRSLLGAELLPPETLAPGVYFFPGYTGAAQPENGGMVANVGVIEGSTGIVVIGTGTSDANGEQLLAAIARLSGKPVVLAINTYAGPEHVLGNSAFARRGIPVLAHRASAAYMQQNCAGCIRNLGQQLAPEALAGTHLERPSDLIDASTAIESGGRHLDLLWFGNTQQAGSIAVYDRSSGVLFAGGLASFDVVPDSRDADIPGWLAALGEMRRLAPYRVVPGRGPSGGAERLDEVATYLANLASETGKAYAAGFSLFETPRRVRLPHFSAWALYDTLHPRNVHYEYLRREAADFRSDPGPGPTRAPDRTD